MSLTTRSDRWAIVAVVLLTLLAVCALVRAVRRRRGRADRATDEHGRADDQRTRRAGPNAVRIPRDTGAAPGRSRIAYQWVRCGADGGRPDGGDCAIVSGATSRDHRLGTSDVGFRMRVRVTATNADGSRVAASNPTGTVTGPPVNRSQPWPRGSMLVGQVVTAEPGTWTGQIADLVLVSLAALQLGGRRVPVDRGRRIAELSRRLRRHRTQAPLQRHRTQLSRIDDRASRRSPPS